MKNIEDTIRVELYCDMEMLDMPEHFFRIVMSPELPEDKFNALMQAFRHGNGQYHGFMMESDPPEVSCFFYDEKEPYFDIADLTIYIWEAIKVDVPMFEWDHRLEIIVDRNRELSKEELDFINGS